MTAIPNQPRLGKLDVHIWKAPLDVEPTVADRLASRLSPEELQRASRFVAPKDRDHFKTSHGILRELLAGYLAAPPAEILLESGSRGKPALSASAHNLDLRFNLSHSHDLALYAFALERELGIDVEKIRPSVALEKIQIRYFSAPEQAELNALPPELRPEAFFLCWTRKEAYIKARGEGLHIPLDSFHVSLIPGAPAVLHSPDRERWSIYSLQPPSGFAAALVVEGNENHLHFHDWRSSANG